MKDCSCTNEGKTLKCFCLDPGVFLHTPQTQSTHEREFFLSFFLFFSSQIGGGGPFFDDLVPNRENKRGAAEAFIVSVEAFIVDLV
jgi:hypothetical protein